MIIITLMKWTKKPFEYGASKEIKMKRVINKKYFENVSNDYFCWYNKKY